MSLISYYSTLQFITILFQMDRLINRLKTVSAKLIEYAVITFMHSATVSVPAYSVNAASTECADGIDNDFDGLIDYPQDSECLSLHDNSEGPTGRGLFIEVYDGLDTVKQSGNITYTIKLQNERIKQREIDVRLFIPHQTNYLSASNGGYRDGDYVIWRNVTVYSGRERELYVNVSVKPRTPIDLLVVAEVVSEGQKVFDTTRVVEGKAQQNLHPVKLSVSDGRAYAEPREKLTYKIVVDNSAGETKEYRLQATVPSHLEYNSASGNPEKKSKNVTWPETTISAGDMHEYILTATVDRDVQDGIPVQLRVSTAEGFASDTTSINKGLLDTAFNVHVTDGYSTITSENIVTYKIFVKNRTSKLATEVDVNNALPSYTEFVSASEGGYWTGTNIRWQGLTISPNGERTLTVSARIRKDAPLGEVLKNRVEVRGNTAVDSTRVHTESLVSSDNQLISTSSRIVLRKIADSSEVQPGESLGYTIYLKNNTKQTFKNVLVRDKMDTRYMRVLGSTYGNMEGDQLVWNIPSLSPGEEWKVRYTVQVSSRVPHGIIMNNVVSVSGEGLETFSLTERVQTGSTGVMTSLPPTGAGFGEIFVSITGLLGIAVTAMQKKLYLLS